MVKNKAGTSNDHRWLTTKRIESLSDGVFAIAMTLLVLNIAAPVMTDPSNEILFDKLIELIPHFFAYAMSFFLLAVFWIIHHKQFSTIKRANETLLWINILCLMLVVLIPFSASLRGEHENLQLAAIFFDMNMLVVGVLFYFQYWYATKNHRLIDKDLDPELVRKGLRKNLLIPGAALVSIGLSFLSPQWSSLPYLIIPFVIAKFLKS